MDFSPLVIAVMVYMKDHYPTTPEEFNFQAQLTAASHWCWPDKDKRRLSLKSGPHNDDRLKIAAQATWQKWIAEVEAHQENDFYRESGKERISGRRLFFTVPLCYYCCCCCRCYLLQEELMRANSPIASSCSFITVRRFS